MKTIWQRTSTATLTLTSTLTLMFVLLLTSCDETMVRISLCLLCLFCCFSRTKSHSWFHQLPLSINIKTLYISQIFINQFILYTIIKDFKVNLTRIVTNDPKITKQHDHNFHRPTMKKRLKQIPLLTYILKLNSVARPFDLL